MACQGKTHQVLGTQSIPFRHGLRQRQRILGEGAGRAAGAVAAAGLTEAQVHHDLENRPKKGLNTTGDQRFGIIRDNQLPRIPKKKKHLIEIKVTITGNNYEDNQDPFPGHRVIPSLCSAIFHIPVFLSTTLPPSL